MQTFKIPGRRVDYVDLRDMFEEFDLQGRFRDWIRRQVKPLLGTAIVEYTKMGAPKGQQDYAIAVQNSEALIVTLPAEKRALKTEPAAVTPTTYPNHFRFRLPVHAISHNAMYEPTSFGARKQLRRSAEYNEWAEVVESLTPAKPRWLKKGKACHVAIKFGHTAPFDTENLMKGTIDTVFSTWRLNDNFIRSGSFSSEIVRSKDDGYIVIDVYQ